MFSNMMNSSFYPKHFLILPTLWYNPFAPFYMHVSLLCIKCLNGPPLSSSRRVLSLSTSLDFSAIIFNYEIDMLEIKWHELLSQICQKNDQALQNLFSVPSIKHH